MHYLITFNFFFRSDRRSKRTQVARLLSPSPRGPTRPQAPRKHKLLWEHFQRETEKFVDGKADRTKGGAICNICKFTLKTPDSTPGPLIRHLKAHHIDEHAAWFKAQKESEKLELEKKKAFHAVQEKEVRSPSIVTFFKRTPYPVNGEIQSRFDLELTKMIVMCNLPFSICDNTWFKQFVYRLDPKLSVKSRTTIGSKKVRILHNNVMLAVKSNLDADLKDVTGMGLTTDTWQSRANDSFQSLTIHYINKDFKLKR